MEKLPLPANGRKDGRPGGQVASPSWHFKWQGQVTRQIAIMPVASLTEQEQSCSSTSKTKLAETKCRGWNRPTGDLDFFGWWWPNSLVQGHIPAPSALYPDGPWIHNGKINVKIRLKILTQPEVMLTQYGRMSTWKMTTEWSLRYV